MTATDKDVRYGPVVCRMNSFTDREKVYEVRFKNNLYTCQCRGFVFSRETPKCCKHIREAIRRGITTVQWDTERLDSQFVETKLKPKPKPGRKPKPIPVGTPTPRAVQIVREMCCAAVELVWCDADVVPMALVLDTYLIQTPAPQPVPAAVEEQPELTRVIRLITICD